MKSGSSSKPAYILLANQLKKRLGAQGEDQLPTFREIAEEYNVTIGVVQRAMQCLKDESLIQVHRSTGSRRVSGDIEPELLCYGLIHPYQAHAESELVISMNLLLAFEQLKANAVPLIRASANNSAQERNNAEQLAANPLIDGMLISPCVNSTNGEFFLELASKKPVVILENTFADINLPTVIFDYAQAGREIGRELRARGCRKTMVLLDEGADNRSLVDLQEAMRAEIAIDICRLPLFRIERECKNWNYELHGKSCVELENFILAHECDSVFSPFDAHFDIVFMGGVRDNLRRNMVSAVICSDHPNWYTENFVRSKVMMWQFSSRELFTTAATRLLNWKRSHQQPCGVRNIKLKRIR